MAGKAERQAARAVVAEYHQAQLASLVSRVAEAIDQHRAGELDPFEVDRVLFQYSRAAKELWKFCNYRPVEFTASTIKGTGTRGLVGTRSPESAIAQARRTPR